MRRNSVRLVVKSKKTPVRVENLMMPIPTSMTPAAKISQRMVIYDYVLDQEQAHLVEETNRLARRHGLPLEVVDLAREMIWAKILRSLTAVVHRPSLVWKRERLEMSRCSDCVQEPNGSSRAKMPLSMS